MAFVNFSIQKYLKFIQRNQSQKFRAYLKNIFSKVLYISCFLIFQTHSNVADKTKR